MKNPHLLKNNHKKRHLGCDFKPSHGWRTIKDKEILKKAGSTNKELNLYFTTDYPTRKAMTLPDPKYCNGDF
jgi:hypothetical protein